MERKQGYFCTASDSFSQEQHQEHGTSGTGFYQVWNNWQGRGYRLFYGGTRYATQIDGEISGPIFRTIKEAMAYCRARFEEDATRMF